MSTEALESATTPSKRDEIVEFCKPVVLRHAEHWPITEDVLANEFIEYFGTRPLLLLTFREVVQLCHTRLRIQVSVRQMPTGCKGFNSTYRDRCEIVISTDQELPGLADLHTLLHELREIIEWKFESIGRPTANCEDLSLEDRAELFATGVQVFAGCQMLLGLLDSASEIKRTWLGISAYIGIFAGAAVYIFGCFSLPQLEDAFAARRPRTVVPFLLVHSQVKTTSQPVLVLNSKICLAVPQPLSSGIGNREILPFFPCPRQPTT